MADYGEKRCQECNHPVAPELDEKIDTGKTVYCEQCGALLTETTVIKIKSRRNLNKHTSPRLGKNEAFTGAYSKSKQREKKKISSDESSQSKNDLQNNYSHRSSWAKWLESFRDFLTKLFKNLRESLGSFSTTLHDEMAKVREETQSKDQKSTQNYPIPIMPKALAREKSTILPSPAPGAPKSPQFISSSPKLKFANKAKFDPYTGKPLNPQEPKIAPGKRFDPFTGKPLITGELEKSVPSHPLRDLPTVHKSEKIVSSQSTNISGEKKETAPPTTRDTTELKPTKSYDEVFMVLTVEVRELLSQLEIPESEKASIAKTFIYLTETQQVKYLNELQSLNSPNYAQLNHLIETIDTLPLPGEQKKILIHQLDYFTDENSHEFVNVIEREVRKDIERLKSNRKSTLEPLELSPEGTESQSPTNDKHRTKLLSD